MGGLTSIRSDSLGPAGTHSHRQATEAAYYSAHGVAFKRLGAKTVACDGFSVGMATTQIEDTRGG